MPAIPKVVRKQKGLAIAIETRSLTKRFGELTAVNKVNMEIEQGELFGLLGPNGAGKTTLISMLCTMLQPTEGSAKVLGLDISENPDEVRKAIGIVFQDPSLDEQLTGRENLDFHGRMYGMKSSHRKERIADVLKLIELEDRADSFVKTYSGGMRRRLEIARGLMHYPKVLFLDEPTLGLDPQTRRRIWEYIKKLRAEKDITIILTTHYMDEADFLCSRIGIMDNGEIIAVGKPGELKGIVEGDVISLDTSEPAKLLDVLTKRKLVESGMAADDTLNLKVRGGEELIPKVVEAARESNITVNSVALHKPTLEDVFIHYTGKKIRDEKGSSIDRARAIVRSLRR